MQLVNTVRALKGLIGRLAATVWLVALMLSPSVLPALVSAASDACCHGKHSTCCKRRSHASGPQMVSNDCGDPNCGCSGMPPGAADSIAVDTYCSGAGETQDFREEIPSRNSRRSVPDAATFQRPPPSC